MGLNVLMQAMAHYSPILSSEPYIITEQCNPPYITTQLTSVFIGNQEIQRIVFKKREGEKG
jgi:hypothetical protein